MTHVEIARVERDDDLLADGRRQKFRRFHLFYSRPPCCRCLFITRLATRDDERKVVLEEDNIVGAFDDFANQELAGCQVYQGAIVAALGSKTLKDPRVDPTHKIICVYTLCMPG